LCNIFKQSEVYSRVDAGTEKALVPMLVLILGTKSQSEIDNRSLKGYADYVHYKVLQPVPTVSRYVYLK